jgi:hypothetical protein
MVLFRPLKLIEAIQKRQPIDVHHCAIQMRPVGKPDNALDQPVGSHYQIAPGFAVAIRYQTIINGDLVGIERANLLCFQYNRPLQLLFRYDGKLEITNGHFRPAYGTYSQLALDPAKTHAVMDRPGGVRLFPARIVRSFFRNINNTRGCHYPLTARPAQPNNLNGERTNINPNYFLAS